MLSNKKNSNFISMSIMLCLFLIMTFNNAAFCKNTNKLLTTQAVQSVRSEEFLFIEDDLVYLHTDSGFTIYNISNPAVPELINHYDFEGLSAGSITNFLVKNNFVYVSDFDNNIYSANCTDPFNIEPRITMHFEDNIKQFSIEGTTLYVIHPQNLTIYNIATQTPVKLGNYYFPATELNHFVMQQDYIYVFHNNFAGFEIINITEKSNPIYYGNWSYSYGLHSVAHFGDNLFLMDVYEHIDIVNITNPINPLNVTRFSNINSLGFQRDIYYLDNLITILYDDGFEILNATDLTNTTKISEYQFKNNDEINFQSLVLIPGFVFVKNSHLVSDLYIFKISELTTPIQVWPRTINLTAYVLTILFGGLMGLFSIVVIVIIIFTRKSP